MRPPNQPFSPEEVRQIRRDLAKGRSRREIAEAYSVGKVTIDRLARGESYKWIPQEVTREELSEEEKQRAAKESEQRMMREWGLLPAEQ